ncbi:MAG: aldo/keto reductase [Verrucomicrobiales bacterium]|nr:aldo/keto reductase [Verrucomicrobiales bacterium]
MTVKRAKLSCDGPELSEIAFGTWRILDQDPLPSAADIATRLEKCLELGITTIDTAEIYGGYTVEAAVGTGLAESADFKGAFEVVTKCGIDVPSETKAGVTLPHYNATAENLVNCAEKSLRHLGVDSIDLFLVHRPDWFTPAEETAKGLDQLISSGKIKHAGVSNYTRDQFELLDSIVNQRLVTNQVEINLLNMDALYDGSLAQCEQRKIRPMGWSVLGGGELFGDSIQARRLREAFEKIREKYDGAGDDALATAWVMAHPSRPLAITGSNKIERIESQAQAGSIQLERQDWYELWSAAKGQSVP